MKILIALSFLYNRLNWTEKKMEKEEREKQMKREDVQEYRSTSGKQVKWSFLIKKPIAHTKNTSRWNDEVPNSS